VIDLVVNLEDFNGRGGLVSTFLRIGQYYAYRVTQIFDKLSESITMLSAMFTVSWMQRNNELLPQLSAGVSTRRVIRPILAGAAITIALGPLNQEFVIPRIADSLQIPRDDPNAERAVPIKGGFDSTGVHIEGARGFRNDRRIDGFYATFPENGPGGMLHLSATEAKFTPSGEDDSSGTWTLFNTTPRTIDGPLPQNLSAISPGVYQLATRDVDFESMTRSGSWYQLASSRELLELLDRPEARRLAPVAVLFHTRFVRPVVGILLVVLGLSMILRDQTRHVLVSAGMCVLMSAMFYGTVFGCRYLGEQDLLAPVFAAWLPVLIFGPLAVALFDAVHT
jgi:lipopolysaccharide export system permease protein